VEMHDEIVVCVLIQVRLLSVI